MLSCQKPVVLCIGTAGVLGDSLGPRVGDLLAEKYCVDAYVYGRTAHPVNGLNYPLYVTHVKRHHAGCFIIAVDACLGEKEDVGKVKVSIKGLRAGAALNKKTLPFGDVGVLGIVAERTEDNLSALLSADRTLVEKVAILSAEKVDRILKIFKLNYSSARIL